MGRGKGPTGRTAKFKRRPRATLRMGEPKVDASSSDGSHASDTADRGTEQLGVIFSKAPEPAQGRSKRETASATVPTGLRKGEVVLALPVTNVRARHAQHTGLGYVHADGGRSSQHVVTGRWAISFVGRSCGVSASRPPPPADVGRASRHGDGRPPGVLVQALHNTGDLTCPRPAGGQKCALHFLGLLLSWAHVCGPQPGGLDRDSRRRPMPLIILGRRRLRLDMTTQGVASRVTTTIRVGDGTLRQCVHK